ncbi:hypothetical protein D6D01_06200 [Aureobasidium pullulans]|uniref:C3H1-type domain-containing protein n=1 Tax=Aureobasidium pullulans TaxID=5580 RepID=A0A4S9L3C7_AURPU|nr:hypothetical protein D6D01_06200 [Aureobasidium pullulans]
MPGLHMSAYAQPGSMAWSIPQYSAVMATQSMLAPGLKFFIERDNGSLIPLVPVDELPDDVRLAGVPHRLSASQTKDMLFLGHHSSARGRFPHEGSVNVKESVPPPSVTMQYTPQSGVSSHNSRLLQPINTQPIAIPASTPGPTSTAKPLASPQLQLRPLYNERPLPPSGIEPDQRKKVYCTYWIQNQGQCAYKQQGCMYRHEMPEDKETLNSIGLKSVPAWWRKEQARKKQKSKRTDRNGSSSEWEVVERQQNDNSALYRDDPVRVRVPPSRPTSSQPTKQAAQKSRSEPASQKVATTTAASGVAITSTSHLEASPPGGVQLGAAKTHIRGPPYFSFKKQTLESPIEEDLIDFDVLVPSSSPDTSYSSVESPVDQRPKDEASRVLSVFANGGVSVSPGNAVGRRSSNGGRNRRGSADKKDGNVTPPRQSNSMMKGKTERGRERIEHCSGVSRGGRIKAAPSTEAKATGEIDMQSDGEA